MEEIKEVTEDILRDAEKVGVKLEEDGVTTTWGDHLAKVVGSVRYTDEEKEEWSRIIKEFNELFYMHSIQTWNNTKWKGIRVLKPATDMWVYQELINEIKPDLIIETGSWAGGSAVFMRDILNLVYPEGKIISIDIEDKNIDKNLKEIPGLEFRKASSVDPETIQYLKAHIAAYKCQKVMVILDSDHNEEHVSKEINLYSQFVTVGSILIVEDTSNNPGPIAAVRKNIKFLLGAGFKKSLMCEKFMLTFCRDGFWEKVS